MRCAVTEGSQGLTAKAGFLKTKALSKHSVKLYGAQLFALGGHLQGALTRMLIYLVIGFWSSVCRWGVARQKPVSSLLELYMFEMKSRELVESCGAGEKPGRKEN